MGKTAVVYWSGTGNTQAMAEAVAQGSAGKMFCASEFGEGMLDDFDAIAFGCPSMGSEELEESEFVPMFERCKAHLPANASLCLAPTAGGMANGCATGKRSVGHWAHCWSPRL